MKQRSIQLCWSLLLAAAFATLPACGEDPPPQQRDGDPATDAGSEPDAGDQDDIQEPEAVDTGDEDTETLPPEPGEYGSPCGAAEDCNSLICVPDGDTGICSNFCLETCADFFPDREAFCRADTSDGGDVAFVCFPNQDLLCQPCSEDAQCDGAPCIETDDGLVCGLVCEDSSECPEGFNCEDVEDRGRACIPANGSCSCNRETQGATRVCGRTNDFGTCLGEETCDFVQGWSGCDAAEAEAEVCNGEDENCNNVADDGIFAMSCQVENDFGACPGSAVCLGLDGFECIGDAPEQEVCDRVDNDCDEDIDEDFKDGEGRYGLFEHCGACNITCQDRFSFAEVVRCDAERESPTCVIDSCVEGYRLIGDALCVPLADVACQPCTQDDECTALSPGAACVTLGDPQEPETLATVCGRDCSQDSLFGEQCDDGFVCRTFREGEEATSQCVPSGGTCFCRDNPEDFSVPCTVSDPNDPQLTCQGTRGCEDEAFGACVLGADSCNGLDDDCDGVIDNDFRDTETGRYILDPEEHCGRCNRNCGDLSFDNALGQCNTDLETPSCEMRCLEGFVDLFNGEDDGCECRFVSEEDLPDGTDQNCDTVDGDVALGVFVSKIGSLGASGEIEDPVLTVQEAIEIVQNSGGTKRDVYVSTGVYSENIVVPENVNVYGGYSLDFLERDIINNQTTLFGVPPQAPERATVTSVGVQSTTVIDGFSIYGYSASEVGRSSYAVFIQDCDEALQLTNCEIFAGNGADGLRGNGGSNGAVGISGQPGVNAAASSSRSCGLAPRVGGSKGVLTCGNVEVSGGEGGDASCPQTQRNNGNIPCNLNSDDCRNSCSAPPCSPLPPPQGAGTDGSGPSAGLGGAPTFDRWSNSGVCGLCGLFPALDHRGNPGQDGDLGPNGAAGQGCGDLTGQVGPLGEWTANSGSNGGSGIHGSGGGGGSAGSGFDVVNGASGDNAECRDVLGGSGGGGGSGGCLGTGGLAGSGGGGSFSVMIHYSQGGFASLPTLADNTLVRGAGGDGGNGGNGGVGGTGGLGAVGGLAQSNAFCAEPGGRGGNGGNGGGGGGGGGSCGGISVGIFLSANGNDLDAAELSDSNTFLESGRGGRGGSGGGSTANPGEAGLDGTVTDVLQR